jgi:hypothetical protein
MKRMILTYYQTANIAFLQRIFPGIIRKEDMGTLSLAQNLIINPGLESWGKVNKPAGWTHIENCLKDLLTT